MGGWGPAPPAPGPALASAQAIKASIPILALVEEFPVADADRNVFQEFDHFALFSSCSSGM